MHIQLQNISKRYGFEWIFKKVSATFEEDKKYAIVGPNGSGKSTLLKIISGGLVPTAGNLSFTTNTNMPLDELEAAKDISFAAPYISLLEDYTLTEMYQFHASFKKMKTTSVNDFFEISQLGMHKNKYIKNFSSGMKQRLKLSLAFMTDSSVLLLDEPTSNFDKKAIDWYLQLIEKYTQNRTLIIGSNQMYEYDFCQESINILNYK
ncbi:MAG TPA: ABC transporter ATP-binding protein [Chitinophagales bacterium]|nr:ABC transporter ATP-binding protein [Chitinophagales bacterium]HQV79070.1 ABC transporter ATP-binding protein [Chitinophagales bacterium]HQW79807.1 ABC transporter ATP-binding protein [Chitinophagales bacterium]HRB19725.1 ABC transporter ATP-binding protein [Chitinophagales bacterium]HRB67751.1 ABC transporter ATP-binding protein [Chitinophagales bacterium]